MDSCVETSDVRLLSTTPGVSVLSISGRCIPGICFSALLIYNQKKNLYSHIILYMHVVSLLFEKVPRVFCNLIIIIIII